MVARGQLHAIKTYVALIGSRDRQMYVQQMHFYRKIVHLCIALLQWSCCWVP